MSGRDPKRTHSDQEWLAGIRKHLSSKGINVPEGALVEPPRRKPWMVSKPTPSIDPVASPKKQLVIPQQVVPKKIPESLKESIAPVVEETIVTKDLIQNPDGTFRIPSSWRVEKKDKETRRKIVSAMNRLKWAVEALEKKDKIKFSKLIQAHRKLVTELMACLN